MKNLLRLTLMATVLVSSTILATGITQGGERKEITPQVGETVLDFSSFYQKNPPDFTNTLANLWVKYPNLKVLKLPVWGHITDTDLENISKCTNLEELSVLSDSLTDKGVEHLANLKNLRKLRLGGHYSDNVKIFRDLSRIEKLEDLELSHHSKNISGNGLQYLTNLKSLNLTGYYSNDILPYLGALVNLENLNLSHEDLRQGPINELTKLRNLKTLNLLWTGITDDQLKVLASTTSEGGRRVPLLSQLRKLNLSYTRITGKSIFELVNFKELIELNLSHNNVSNEDYLVGLTRLPKLRKLGLNSTNLKDSDLKYIGQIKTLDELDIFGNPLLTDAGAKYLKDIRMVNAPGAQFKTVWVTDDEVNRAGLLLKNEFNRIGRRLTQQESIDVLINHPTFMDGSRGFQKNKAVALLKKLEMWDEEGEQK